MNDEELQKLTDEYKDSILESSGRDVDRFLMALVKEVERNTRHAAVAAAYNLANELNNMNRL